MAAKVFVFKGLIHSCTAKCVYMCLVYISFLCPIFSSTVLYSTVNVIIVLIPFSFTNYLLNTLQFHEYASLITSR